MVNFDNHKYKLGDTVMIKNYSELKGLPGKVIARGVIFGSEHRYLIYIPNKPNPTSQSYFERMCDAVERLENFSCGYYCAYCDIEEYSEAINSEDNDNGGLNLL